LFLIKNKKNSCKVLYVSKERPGFTFVFGQF
jgi:hypothetical protein